MNIIAMKLTDLKPAERNVRFHPRIQSGFHNYSEHEYNLQFALQNDVIENSTLTLEDTEDILLRDTIKRDHDIREIYEAKNLAKITEYLLNNQSEKLTIELIPSLHKMLFAEISNGIAGRFPV